MKKLIGLLSIIVLVSAVAHAKWLPSVSGLSESSATATYLTKSSAALTYFNLNGDTISGDTTINGEFTAGTSVFQVANSSGVVVGSAGTRNFIDGVGDLYVQDELELDGTLYVAGQTHLANFVGLDDAKGIELGTDNDYTIVYSNSRNQTEFYKGSYAAGNVGWRMPSAKYIAIGGAGTVNNASQSGDLYVQGVLEVDDQARMSAVIASGNITAQSNIIATGGYIRHMPKTEAELKAITPAAAGESYYDSTNAALVISTGTTLAAFGQITDGTQVPTGW